MTKRVNNWKFIAVFGFVDLNHLKEIVERVRKNLFGLFMCNLCASASMTSRTLTFISKSRVEESGWSPAVGQSGEI